MATRPDTISTFIAKLLAPLPADVEQAADKKFMRRLRTDANDIWEEQMSKTRRAYHVREAHENSRSDDAFMPYVKAIDAQMRIPAPHQTALKWKIQHRKINGGHPDWEAAMARDEAWLTTTA